MYEGLAREPGDPSERVELLRKVVHWTTDPVVDVLHPMIGTATVPVLIVAPLLVVTSAWGIRRRLRV
ncbi:hypothetical protein [Nocardia sp. NBC_00511]|uniref:hypothetical protein n=1 Tax=Nocardia sp. NBC_00511 TaxID=2903591 RepID=UPI0030E35DF2